MKLKETFDSVMNTKVSKKKFILMGGAALGSLVLINKIPFADALGVTIPARPSSGGGGISDGKVKVSSGDTTSDYLYSKLTQGTNITLTKLNSGSNESIQISATSSGVPYTGATSNVNLGQHTLTATELIENGSRSLTYNGSGQVTQVATTNGTTITITYNIDGTPATKSNGTNTWTYNWSGGQLTGVAVT